VSVDDAFAVARSNLANIAQQSLDRDWPDATSMIRMVDDGNGYFTSLLLAPGWLAAVSDRMGTPITAFVPDVNSVVLTATVGAGGLYEMIEQHYREAVRSLSPVGYVADVSGHVVPYRPAPDHADYVVAKRAEVILALAEYGAQTQWLTDQYRQAGIDTFVVPLHASEKRGSAPRTFASWTNGITSLLPEADVITFPTDSGPVLRVPWRAVASHLGLRPEPLMSPPRYRVGDWPPPDVMYTLRASTID